MKTGLVTFYHIHHYGALFQAAATQHAVRALGSECEIVDYYVNQNNALFRKPTGLSSAAADVHTALHYGPLKARYDRFEAFAKAHLQLSAKHYETREELYRAKPEYDQILSGSDQIWNPTIYPDRHFDPVFFGGFADCRKISYAPSFGVSKIPEGMEEELKGYLENYSHISVRERWRRSAVRRCRWCWILRCY